MQVQRVQITMEDQALEVLDRMQKKAKIKTRADTVRQALGLLDWAIDKKEQGYSIVAVKEGSKVAKELSMPILDAIQRESEACKVEK